MSCSYFDEKRLTELPKKSHWIEPLQLEIDYGKVFSSSFLGFECHPCVADFPELSGAPFKQLCDALLVGQIVPILLFVDRPDSLPVIIDGRNRVRAHKRNAELTGKPQTALFLLLSDQLIAPRTPREISHLLNIARRELPAGARAIIAAENIDLYRRFALLRMRHQESDEDKETGKATKVAGRAAGVSHTTIEAALEILQLGVGELTDAIRSGWLPLHTGHRLCNSTREEILQLLNPRIAFPAHLDLEERAALRVKHILDSIRKSAPKVRGANRQTRRAIQAKKYPPEIRPVIRQTERLTKAIDELHSLCAQANPEAAQLLERSHIRALTPILEKLRRAAFKKICPKARYKSHGEACAVCGGKGWLRVSDVAKRRPANSKPDTSSSHVDDDSAAAKTEAA